jgi:hypothetical protein
MVHCALRKNELRGTNARRVIDGRVFRPRKYVRTPHMRSYDNYLRLLIEYIRQLMRQ